MKQVASVRTQPIADNDLKALIDVALDYLEKRAPRLLHCLEEFHLFAETVRPRPAVKYQPEKDFFARREEVRSSCERNSKLLQLRTACFILIGFSTGMRLSEILATKRGCIRQEATSNHGIFYWIDSKLFKTQKIGSGSDRSWMCGPLAKRAVETLETLGSLLGAPVQTPYLFFSFQHFAADASFQERDGGSNRRNSSFGKDDRPVGPGGRRKSCRSRLFRLLLFLDDPGVSLICQLGETEQVVNAEGIVASASRSRPCKDGRR